VAKRVRRAKKAKDGEIVVSWGRLDSHESPSVCVAWGDGTSKSTARLILDALLGSRGCSGRTLVEELELRGYDIATLEFRIQKKSEPISNKPE